MKKKLVLSLLLALSMTMSIPVYARDSWEVNPPNVTEDTFTPFGPNLEEDYKLEETTPAECEAVDLTEENFPDETLRNYIGEKFDGDKDGKLSAEEVQNVKKIDNEWGAFCFKDLTGIEHFKNLQWLSATYCLESDSLDLSQNKKLQIVEIDGAKLSHLNIGTDLKELRILKVSDVPSLTEVDLTNCPELRWLWAYGTGMNSVDVSKNPKLKRLAVTENKNFTSVDVTNNPRLQALDITGTGITSINLMHNHDLYEFYLQNVPITNLDFSQNWNLQQLWLDGNPISTVDFTHTPHLCVLYAQRLENLTELNVGNLASMYELYVDETPIKELDTSKMTNLNCVQAPGTKISKLDITKSPKIHGIDVSRTDVSELDLSQCQELYRIEVAETPIEKLDLSVHTGLTTLNIAKTNIADCKDFDISPFKDIQSFFCQEAGINSLVFGENADLFQLETEGNPLTHVELSGAGESINRKSFAPVTSEQYVPFKDGKLVFDIHELGVDPERVTPRLDEDEKAAYDYDSKTGIITFDSYEGGVFKYDFATGYKYENKNGIDNIHCAIQVNEEAKSREIRIARENARKEIEEVNLGDVSEMTEKSIAKAETALKKAKEDALAAVEEATTVEEIENAKKINIKEIKKHLVTRLAQAKIDKKKEINSVTLDITEDIMKKSIPDAEKVLENSKKSACEKVDAAQSVEEVEAIEFDNAEAQKSLITFEEALEEAEKTQDNTSDLVVEDEVENPSVTKSMRNTFAGKDVTLKLHNKNYTWSINCKGMKKNSDKEVDLTVNLEEKYPDEKIKKQFDGEDAFTLDIAHDGKFNFEAVLKTNVNEKNAGKMVSVYRVGEGDKLSFTEKVKVDENGFVELTFDHASKYVLVVDEKRNSQKNKNDEKKNSVVNSGNPKTGDAGATTALFGTVGGLISALGISLKKKNK